MTDHAHRRPRILIVDDNEPLRRLLRIALAGAGFDVLTAANGPEARGLLSRHPDTALALLDVCMPGESGPETLHALRAFRPDLPFCFMTGDPGDYEPADLWRLGARAIIAKPFELPMLIETLRAHLLAGDTPRAA